MKIQLPDFIIADLYKDSLVIADDLRGKIVSQNQENKITELPKATGEKQPEQKAKKHFLGENKKNIVILVSDKENVFLGDESLQLLTGILAACKLNLADVAIINHHNTGYNYQQLKQELQPKHVFMFDVTPQQIQLPFTMPQYQKQPHDNCIFLTVPSLKIMQPNTKEAKVEKSKLWVCLKGIFEV